MQEQDNEPAPDQGLLKNLVHEGDLKPLDMIWVNE